MPILCASAFFVTPTREGQMFDLVLVSCCGKKREFATSAYDLYRSPLFLASRQYAWQNGKKWAILSAQHGLVWPFEELSPYDFTLANAKPHEIELYFRRVVRSLRTFTKDFREANDGRPPHVAVLAGRDYLEPIRSWGLCSDGPDITDADGRPIIEYPLQKMGIGKRLQFLKRATQQQQPQLF
jgi:hypothetical protein